MIVLRPRTIGGSMRNAGYSHVTGWVPGRSKRTPIGENTKAMNRLSNAVKNHSIATIPVVGLSCGEIDTI